MCAQVSTLSTMMGRAAATAASVLGRPAAGHARREAEDGPACVIRSHQAAVCSLAISEELGLVLSADVEGRCLLHRAPSGVCVGEPWSGGGTRRPVATALSRCSGHLAVAFTDVTGANGVDVLSVGGHMCRSVRLDARPVHVDFGRQDLTLLIATEDEVRACPFSHHVRPLAVTQRRRRRAQVRLTRLVDGGEDAEEETLLKAWGAVTGAVMLPDQSLCAVGLASGRVVGLGLAP